MVTLRINGKSHQVDVPPDMPVLWVLRDVLGMTGTKFGCGMALCGACTVQLDGQAIGSCVTADADRWREISVSTDFNASGSLPAFRLLRGYDVKM
jgi:isoquinoline 1-oxidoreductase subunit alpha